MTRERALKIANHFIQFSNPTGWNGVGRKRPMGFTVRTRTYPGGRGGWLRLKQYKEPGLEWRVRCELVDRKTCEPVNVIYSTPIYDTKSLAECLLVLCQSLQ